MYEQEMTILSQQMFYKATSGYLTLHQAAAELKENAHVRSVCDVLSAATRIPKENKNELSEYLVNALMKTDPETKRDSIARKIRMWLNGDVMTISKSGAIQLAFALGLSFPEADELLVKLCEENFHWRDPEELVFIFALQNSMNYVEACALRKELSDEGLLDTDNVNTELFTADVEYELCNINSVQEFKAWLAQRNGELGKFHNTAYSIFTEMMDLLMNPDGQENAGRESVSVRDIVSNNLYAELIPRFKKSGKDSAREQEMVLSALQKNVRDNWPDETTLSKMANRRADVTRKTMILLFLATDGGTSLYGDWNDDDQTDEEIFEERYERMKEMLIDCGFAPLDPRSSFDWMVLYCMCTDDALLIDSQMQGFLKSMFS